MTGPRALDLLAARAFPAAETAVHDGWLLRRTPGAAPRRGSSGLPPARGGAAGLDTVERWYRRRGAQPAVMVTPAEQQGELDAALAARGWSVANRTDVLVARAGQLRADADGVDVRTGGLALFDEPVRSAVYARIPDPVVPLVAEGGAGRALVVVQDGWSLAMELEVDPEHRGRGLARALIAAWARLAGDRGLYLQVLRDNAPAQRLYAATGFTRSHGYHYRLGAASA